MYRSMTIRLVLILCLVALTTTNSHALSHVAKVIFIKGKVYKLTETTMNPIKKGEYLDHGEWVETGERSIAILGFDKDYRSKMKVMQNSKVQITKRDKKRAEANLSLGGIIVKYLIGGEKKSNEIKFKVKAVSASMGVRGTTFLTYIGPLDSTIGVVKEGEVEVISYKDKKPLMLSSGFGTMTNLHEKLLAPKKYSWIKQINWSMDGSDPDTLQPDSILQAINRSWGKRRLEDSFNHKGRDWEQKLCFGKKENAGIDKNIISQLEKIQKSAIVSAEDTQTQLSGFVEQERIYNRMVSYLIERHKSYEDKITAHFKNKKRNKQNDNLKNCQENPTKDCETICWIGQTLDDIRGKAEQVRSLIFGLKAGKRESTRR
jgi:hypothetical protein